MTTRFLQSGIWERITALTKKQSGKCHIAVAYFGKHASELLPLAKGSTLVVDMSLKAVGSGQTNPSEIIKLLKRGVEIHSVENLHAKVFVLGKFAIIGSTNASQLSAGSLIEAAVETTDEAVVSSCKRFVLDNAGEYITLQYARRMKSLYKPPKIGKRSSAPQHSPLWVVSLVRRDWDAEDNAADKEGTPKAEEKLRSTQFYRVDKFAWTGKASIDKFRQGHQLLQIFKENMSRFLYPAGRILHIERYQVGNGARAIIYLEVRKKLKRKKLSLVLEELGPPAKVLKKIEFARLLRNRSLVHDLLNLWPRRNTPALQSG